MALFLHAGDMLNELLDEGLELTPAEPILAPIGGKITHEGGGASQAILPD